MKFTAIPALLLAATVPALAKPNFSLWTSLLEKRATTDPAVLYPHQGTVWSPNQVHNVTWNTQGLTPGTCGAVLNTALYLSVDGVIANDGSYGSLTNAISSNFSLSKGRIEVFVPINVVNNNNYAIVLKADTSDSTDIGAFSGNFAIVA